MDEMERRNINRGYRKLGSLQAGERLKASDRKSSEEEVDRHMGTMASSSEKRMREMRLQMLHGTKKTDHPSTLPLFHPSNLPYIHLLYGVGYE
jgi:hypothetical protein